MCRFHRTLYYLIYDWHILGKNSNALNDNIPVRTSFTTTTYRVSHSKVGQIFGLLKLLVYLMSPDII